MKKKNPAIFRKRGLGTARRGCERLPRTYVMTTGATLLVMMDLALLLWSPKVWKEWMLRERWSSMLPSPGAPLSGGDAETACCAALAVVPIIRRRLRRDGEMAGMGRRQRPQGTQGEREGEEDFFFFFAAVPILGRENPRQAQGQGDARLGRNANAALSPPLLQRAFFLPACHVAPSARECLDPKQAEVGLGKRRGGGDGKRQNAGSGPSNLLSQQMALQGPSSSPSQHSPHTLSSALPAPTNHSRVPPQVENACTPNKFYSIFSN